MRRALACGFPAPLSTARCEATDRGVVRSLRQLVSEPSRSISMRRTKGRSPQRNFASELESTELGNSLLYAVLVVSRPRGFEASRTLQPLLLFLQGRRTESTRLCRTYQLSPLLDVVTSITCSSAYFYLPANTSHAHDHECLARRPLFVAIIFWNVSWKKDHRSLTHFCASGPELLL